MYAFVQHVPIDDKIYARIREQLGAEPPVGLISHTVERLSDGLRYTDIWESEEAWNTFAETRLHPIVGPLLREFEVRTNGEPERVPVDIIEVWNRSGLSTPVESSQVS